MDNYSIVIELIKEQFNLDEGIDSSTNIIDDLGADSFEIFSLVSTIEHKFDIHISMKDIEEVTTIDHILKIIERCKAVT